MLIRALLLCALPLLAAPAFAAEKTFEYKEGEAVLEGFVATPKGAGKKAAVVIVHEWDGLGDYVKMRARKLAELGYVAVGADIYGKGIRPKNAEESATLANKYRSDRPLLRRRVRAAIDAAAKMKEVDPARIAIMGYCFGGTAALEAARDGAPLKSVVSFHGGLGTPMKAKKMEPKVLVLHGADDPLVPPAEVEEFKKEMKESGADWQLVAYGNAVHSFTNPATPWKPGMDFGYNEAADHRSWEAMKDFFAETLKK